MAHILIVVARKFNGHELWTALGILQKAGHTFTVRSTSVHIEDEVTGKKVTIKETLDDPIDMSEYDAFMIVSGNMADTELYWRDARVLKYIEWMHQNDKPIAAICCSVPTIRHAAKGKRVSFFPLIRSKILLTEAGAVLSKVSLSVDGKLVTAEHQMMSQMWAEAFDSVLRNEAPKITLVDSGYVPKGRERKPIAQLEKIKTILKETGKDGFDE